MMMTVDQVDCVSVVASACAYMDSIPKHDGIPRSPHTCHTQLQLLYLLALYICMPYPSGLEYLLYRLL